MITYMQAAELVAHVPRKAHRINEYLKGRVFI